MRACIACGKELKRWSSKYCSNKCQWDRQYELFIDYWKKGIVTGNRGVHTKSISLSLRRYLIEKFEEKCALCGWCERNPVTGKVPIEVDHLDGNADNNCEDNLRLLCPNCHSLTPNFRNLNKGRGRAWRSNKKMPT